MKNIFTRKSFNCSFAAPLIILMGVIVSACTTTYSGVDYDLEKEKIGTHADISNPPQLVRVPDSNGIAWDRPKAFGPTPADQVKAGQAICQQISKDQFPLGYNPNALDLDGKPIKNGGFLCAQVRAKS